VAVAAEFAVGGLAGIFAAVIVLITGGEVNAFGLQIAAIKDPNKAKLLGATLGLLGIAFIAVGFVVNQEANSSSQRNTSRQISESRSPLPGGSAAKSNVLPSKSSSPSVIAQGETEGVNSGSARIQWGPGNLLITNNGTSLSTSPPGSVQGFVGDVYGGGDGIYPFGGTTLLLWAGKGQPTPQQCQELAVTQGNPGQGISVVPGSVVCAITAEGPVAIIQVISTNAANYTIETRTTIWDLPGS
jgi:hypothetical protein